jgi:YhcH/YjgK/YiaL family protein
MIFDANQRLAAYGAGSLWEDICRVVTGIDASHPEGEFLIRGRDTFYRVMSYATKEVEECRIEGHREYIDIQFSLDGAEGVDIFPVQGLFPNSTYDVARDVEFYKNNIVQIASTVNLPGYFTMLFPWDLHRPQRRTTNSAHVKKAVIKIKQDKFLRR